jgi:hypothetical protein
LPNDPQLLSLPSPKVGLLPTFYLENDLNNKGRNKVFSLLNIQSPDLIDDISTIDRDIILDDAFSDFINTPLESTFSVGVGQDSKWFAGFSYSTQNAVEFENDALQNNNVSYSKTNKLAFGGFYIPKAESLTNYWNKVTYRAGFYSKNIGLKIDNTEVKDFGISFGVTLPSKRKLSNINLGFDIGKRGEVNTNLVEENYFNFKLSLSFTDKWFKKRKIN